MEQAGAVGSASDFGQRGHQFDPHLGLCLLWPCVTFPQLNVYSVHNYVLLKIVAKRKSSTGRLTDPEESDPLRQMEVKETINWHATNVERQTMKQVNVGTRNSLSVIIVAF